MKKDTQKSLARKEKKEQKQKKKEQKFFDKYGVTHEDLQKKQEKTKIKYTWKILKYIKGEIKGLVFMLFLLGLILAIQIVTPLLLSHMIDSAVAGQFSEAIKFTLIYGIFILSGPLWLWYVSVSSRVFNRIVYRLRLDLIKQTEASCMDQFSKVSSGKIMSRVNTDPNAFFDKFVMIIQTLRRLLMRGARLAIFFTFSWQIGLFVLVSGFVIWLINLIYSKKVLVPAEQLTQAVNDNYNSLSAEMVRGMRDIKSLNIFSHFFARFSNLANNKRNAATNNSVKESVSEELILFGGLIEVVYLVMLIFGINLISSGDITIGQFSSILVYAWDALYTFPELSRIQRYLYSMEVSAKRMYDIIDDVNNPKEKFGTTTLKTPKGKVEFKDVCFAYDDEPVFEKLNLIIQPGQSIGFVGRSGEGKSTILNLIPRIYDVKGGQVLIDGVDNRKLTKDSLRETVSVVPQSPYVFNMSVLDNLKLVNPNATMEEIEDACKRAAILDFIKSKPNGFNTIVGEGGIMLSGGQKQRLAIARAFLKRSKILLLDEATSALDNESQDEIKKAIHNLQKKCTIIIVAHRLTTVQDCDKIFVLDGHKIVGEGTHEYLSKHCKAYRDLYKQENK